MAFIVHSTDDHRVPVLEYLPVVSQLHVKVGLALVLNASIGVLGVAAGTTKPEYICMCDRSSVAAGELIPVIRVQPDMIFETTFSVAASAVKLGSQVTIASGGMEVTATTEGGVAQIVVMDGTAAGATCRVRFV